MDVLCFHRDADYRKNLRDNMKSMGLECECYEDISLQFMEKMCEEKKPYVVVGEITADNIQFYRDSEFFTIALLRPADRAYVSKLKDKGCKNYLIIDSSMTNFKQLFMRMLLSAEKKDPKIRQFLNEDRIAKNVVYAYGFSWGKSYITGLEMKDRVFSILPEMARDNIHFFIAVREKPNTFYKLPNSRIVWVTDIVGKDRIKPHNLTILTDSIIRFIEDKKSAIVVMDCVEYLLLYNDFINILRNLELINSYVMEFGAILIIIVDNNAYTLKEYSLLRRYAMEWKGV